MVEIPNLFQNVTLINGCFIFLGGTPSFHSAFSLLIATDNQVRDQTFLSSLPLSLVVAILHIIHKTEVY